ncbi:MAG: hypothetical protein HC893_09660 [Chloroflexaceae bacterium]|nr:hypothetical protein [Chloroflexaceae bacterium]
MLAYKVLVESCSTRGAGSSGAGVLVTAGVTTMPTAAAVGAVENVALGAQAARRSSRQQQSVDT